MRNAALWLQSGCALGRCQLVIDLFHTLLISYTTCLTFC
jgi:hypothetical protein